MIKNNLEKLHAIRLRVMPIVSYEYFILGLILLTGIFLRFKGLNFQSLWYDELLSVIRSAPDRSVMDILTTFQNDPHPPLFFLSLHFWMSLFGYNEVAARFLVALAGSASVISIYWLGKECYSKKAGLLASLLVSFNFYNIYYSQEVRPYILLFLFTTLSFTFFIKLIRTQSRRNVIMYSVFTALMMYSHYYGLIHLLAQCIFLLYYLALEKGFDLRSLLKHFFGSGGLIILLYSPWIPTTLKMMGKSKHWNPKPKSDFFLDLFNRFFGSEPFLVYLFTGLILLLLFHFISVRKSGTSDSSGETSTDPALEKLSLSVPVIFSWVFFTLFIPYFRSLVTIPMYYHKYAIGTLPALMVLVSIAILVFKSRIFKALLVTAVLLVSITNIFLHVDHYGKIRKQDWRGSINFIVKTSKSLFPDREVYILTPNLKQYQFYLDPGAMENKKFHYLPPKPRDAENALKKRVQENMVMWILPGHKLKPNKRVLAFIKKNFKQVKKKNLGLGDIILWEPRNPPTPEINTKSGN